MADPHTLEVERRCDGWPLCPQCGEDELGCLDTPSLNEPWDLNDYLAHELFCYRCVKYWTAGMFALKG